jgi:iron-sulfur cluster assembly accessory protein
MTTAPSETVSQDRAHQVTLTDAAADKARTLIRRDGSPEMMLRMAVQPGGCSGLRYELFFDDRSLDGDAVVDFDGVRLVVDKMSKPYLDGATIDFADTIEKQGFSIDNPNAQSSCACGDSFH